MASLTQLLHSQDPTVYRELKVGDFCFMFNTTTKLMFGPCIAEEFGMEIDTTVEWVGKLPFQVKVGVCPWTSRAKKQSHYHSDHMHIKEICQTTMDIAKHYKNEQLEQELADTDFTKAGRIKPGSVAKNLFQVRRASERAHVCGLLFAPTHVCVYGTPLLTHVYGQCYELVINKRYEDKGNTARGARKQKQQLSYEAKAAEDRQRARAEILQQRMMQLEIQKRAAEERINLDQATAWGTTGDASVQLSGGSSSAAALFAKNAEQLKLDRRSRKYLVGEDVREVSTASFALLTHECGHTPALPFARIAPPSVHTCVWLTQVCGRSSCASRRATWCSPATTTIPPRSTTWW